MAEIKLRLKLEDMGDLDILKPMNEEFEKMERHTDDIGKNLEDIKKINFKQLMFDLNRAMGEGARVVFNITKQLADMNIEAAKGARELNILAQSVGLSVGELDGLGDAAELAGMSLGDIQKMMSKLSTDVTDGSGKLTAAGKAMQGLGVQAQTANGEIRESGVLFKETINAILKLDSNAQKVDVFGSIFGKRNTGFITDLIGRGVKDFEGIGLGSTILSEKDYRVLTKYREQIRELGDVLEDIQRKSASQFADLFGTSIEGFTIMLDGLVTKYPFLAGVLTVGGVVAGSFPELVQAITGLTIAFSTFNISKFAAASGAGDLLGSAAGAAAGAGAAAAAAGAGAGAGAAAAKRQTAAAAAAFEALEARVKANLRLSSGPSAAATTAEREASRAEAIAAAAEAKANAIAATKLSRDSNAFFGGGIFNSLKSGIGGLLKSFWPALAVFLVNQIPNLFGKPGFIQQAFGAKSQSEIARESETRAISVKQITEDVQKEIERTGSAKIRIAADREAIVGSVAEFQEILDAEAEKQKGTYVYEKTMFGSKAVKKPGDPIMNALEEMSILYDGLNKKDADLFDSLSAQAADAAFSVDELNTKLKKTSKELEDVTKGSKYVEELASVDIDNLDDSILNLKEVGKILSENNALSNEKIDALEKQKKLLQEQDSILRASYKAPGTSQQIKEQERIVSLTEKSLENAKASGKAFADNFGGAGAAALLVGAVGEEYKQLKKNIEQQEKSVALEKARLNELKTGGKISAEDLMMSSSRLEAVQDEIDLLKEKNEELLKAIKLKAIELKMSANQQTIDEATAIDGMSQSGINMIANSKPTGKLFEAKAKQIELEFQKDIIEGIIPKEEAMRKRHIAMFELKLNSFKENIERLKSLANATLANIDARLSIAVAVGDDALADQLRKQRATIEKELIERQASIAKLGDPVEAKTLSTMQLAEALRLLQEELDKISRHFQKIAETNKIMAEGWKSWSSLLGAKQEARMARGGAFSTAEDEKKAQAEELARLKELAAAQANFDERMKSIDARRKANNGQMTPDLLRGKRNAEEILATTKRNIETDRITSSTDRFKESLDRGQESVSNYIDSLNALKDFYGTKAAGLTGKEQFEEAQAAMMESLRIQEMIAQANLRVKLTDMDRGNDMIARQEYQNSLMGIANDRAKLIADEKKRQDEAAIKAIQDKIDMSQAMLDNAEILNKPLKERKQLLEQIVTYEMALSKELSRQGEDTEALKVKNDALKKSKEEMLKLTFGQELLMASGGSKGGIETFLKDRFGETFSNTFTGNPFITSPEVIQNLKAELGINIVNALGEVLKGDASAIPNGAIDKLQEVLQTTILKTIEEVFKR